MAANAGLRRGLLRRALDLLAATCLPQPLRPPPANGGLGGWGAGFAGPSPTLGEGFRVRAALADYRHPTPVTLYFMSKVKAVYESRLVSDRTSGGLTGRMALQGNPPFSRLGIYSIATPSISASERS